MPAGLGGGGATTEAARPFSVELFGACEALFHNDALSDQWSSPLVGYTDACKNTSISFDCVGSVGGKQNVPPINYSYGCIPENR